MLRIVDGGLFVGIVRRCELLDESWLVVAEQHNHNGLFALGKFRQKCRQIGIGARDCRHVFIGLGRFLAVHVDVHHVFFCNRSRVVAAVVGDGHVEDELRSFAFIHDLKNFVVGRSVRHHVAEIFGAIEARDVEELVEPELLVDAIAAPVLRIGGMDGARGIANRFQIRCQVVNAFEVIEHIGVHARSQKAHARSCEELEFAVARAAAHRRHIDIARGNGSRVRREGNGAVVAFRQLRIRRNVGIRFVHDGDDGGAHVGVGGFGGAYHAGVVDELVDGFRHGLLASKFGGARFRIAFGLVRRDLLGTLREAQQRPLRLVRIEAAPHVDVDVQVVFDVDRREADAARGKGCGAKGGVHDGGFPRVLGRRHNRNCRERGEHHGDAECERVVDGVFIAAAHRRRGVNGEHVGRQNGLAFELRDEMVGDTA